MYVQVYVQEFVEIEQPYYVRVRARALLPGQQQHDHGSEKAEQPNEMAGLSAEAISPAEGEHGQAGTPAGPGPFAGLIGVAKRQLPPVARREEETQSAEMMITMMTTPLSL